MTAALAVEYHTRGSANPRQYECDASGKTLGELRRQWGRVVHLPRMGKDAIACPSCGQVVHTRRVRR